MTRTQRWTLVAATIGSGIVFLDGTIVNLALKAIGELPTTFLGVLEGQAYIVAGYLAVLSALLILSGALADYYGRRKIFAIGLTGFGISSLLCGIAPEPRADRRCSGSSRARPARCSCPGSLSIITATFEGPARARAFGTWAAATSGAGPVRPADRRAARRPPLVAGRLPDQRPARRDRAVGDDPPHAGVARRDRDGRLRLARRESSARSRSAAWRSARLAARRQNWQDTLAWASLIVGAVALVIFPFLMRRPHPLVPLSLFRIREFAVINLSTFLIYAALYVDAVLHRGAAPGDARLHGDGRGAGRACRAGSCSFVLSSRVGAAAGPDRAEAVPRRSGRCSWPRACCGGPGSRRPRSRGWRRSTTSRRSSRRRRCSSTCSRRSITVRARDRARRRAADEHADELHPDPQRGARLGDQQRAVAGRPAAHRGACCSSSSRRRSTRASARRSRASTPTTRRSARRSRRSTSRPTDVPPEQAEAAEGRVGRGVPRRVARRGRCSSSAAPSRTSSGCAARAPGGEPTATDPPPTSPRRRPPDAGRSRASP